jgi:hypothetical protein
VETIAAFQNPRIHDELMAVTVTQSTSQVVLLLRESGTK